MSSSTDVLTVYVPAPPDLIITSAAAKPAFTSSTPMTILVVLPPDSFTCKIA